MNEVIENQEGCGNKRYTIRLVLTELDPAKAGMEVLDYCVMFQGDDKAKANEAFETIQAGGADFYKRIRQLLGKDVKSGQTD